MRVSAAAGAVQQAPVRGLLFLCRLSAFVNNLQWPTTQYARISPYADMLTLRKSVIGIAQRYGNSATHPSQGEEICLFLPDYTEACVKLRGDATCSRGEVADAAEENGSIKAPGRNSSRSKGQRD